MFPLSSLVPQSSSFHTSPAHYDLLAFFEPKDNWGETKISAGMSNFCFLIDFVLLFNISPGKFPISHLSTDDAIMYNSRMSRNLLDG